MRGYAAIGLFRPKHEANMGGVLRAAHCYGAAMVAVAGGRFKKSAADTTKAWRHIPLLMPADLFDAIPYACVPVAVDLVPGARSLIDYRHPERAFYIFGPEDGTLGRAVVDRCRDAIAIPTDYCMNLAATVNVVLYDRLAKMNFASDFAGRTETVEDVRSGLGQRDEGGLGTALHREQHDGALHAQEAGEV